MIIRIRACKSVLAENSALSTKNIFQLNFFKNEYISSNFALKTNVAFLFYFYLTNVTECDSRIPQNRLPLEEQNLILRAFLCFYEKALNNSLLGQHKSVNGTNAESTLSLIKEVYQTLFPLRCEI